MTFIEKIEDYIFWAITGIATSVAGFGALLIRKVFTSEKKIALLEADLEKREQSRNEDRERMANIEAAQSQLALGMTNLQNALIGSKVVIDAKG